MAQFDDTKFMIPGAVVAGIHGSRRNSGSIGWTAGWAVFGYAFPLLAVGLALYQGFGKPKVTP